MTNIATQRLVEISIDVWMPIIGLGTWELNSKQNLHEIIEAGLACGYRFIDTAYAYSNEHYIGESLKILLPKYNLTRKDIFITSKLPTSHQGSALARQAALESLKKLQVEYLDLYLIHFPGSQKVPSDDSATLQKLRKESWLELEKLHDEGKIKAIGVSNYTVRHLKELLQYATTLPAVNQCEYHPHNVSTDIVDFCRSKKIHFQAYSSLGTAHSGRSLFKEPLVVQLCSKYGCTPAQLLLAWSINQQISVLPKTTNVSHVTDNLKALAIEMHVDDIIALKSLPTTFQHYCWDPNNVA